MKLMIASLLLACISLIAHAQVTIDISKFTCGQFVGYKITEPKNIALWLSGYYHGKQGNTIVDTQGLVENARKIDDYCLRHMQDTVMQAVEAVFGVAK